VTSFPCAPFHANYARRIIRLDLTHAEDADR
jgi:hypothetical protein